LVCKTPENLNQNVTMDIFSSGKAINHKGPDGENIKVTRYVRAEERNITREILKKKSSEYVKEVILGQYRDPSKNRLMKQGNIC
jgi:hypothetical protein